MKLLALILVILCSLGNTARSNEVPRYLLQVNIPLIFTGNRNFELSKKYCKEFHEYISVLEKRPVEGECHYQNEVLEQDELEKFGHRIEITKLGGKHLVNAEIINTVADTKGLVYKWETSEEIRDVKKLLRKFVNFKNEENLVFIEMSAEEAFEKNRLEEKLVFENYKKAKKHYVRSILEIAGILGVGGGFYQLLDFSHDRDFDYTWDGLKRKFSREGFRFDDNHRMYNFYAHPFVGSMYYQVARTNGLNAAEGYLMAFVSSALWEFVAEFPEVSSVNDQFQTAFAGPSIGEAAYQLSQFFRTGGDTLFNKIARNIFSPLAGIHYWADKDAPPHAQNLDQYGMNNNFWHRINIYSKVSAYVAEEIPPKMQAAIGFNMQVNTVEGLMEPGEKSKVEFDTLFVEMAAELGLSGELKHEFMFYAKSVFMGLVKKNIRKNKDGSKSGYSLIFGPSSAYNLQEGDFNGKFDKMAFVNFVGTTLDMSVFIKGVHIRASFDVFADFTSVRSLALEDYQEDHLGEIIKANLAANKYYNGLGFTQSGKLEVSYRNVGTRMKWEYHKVWSFDGLERNVDEITQDFDLEDTRGIADIQLFYNIPRYGLNLGLGYELKYGASAISNIEGEPGTTYETTSMGHTAYLTFGFEF